MQADVFALFVFCSQIFGNDHEGTSSAGEAGVFAETAKFDGDIFGAFNFIDAARNARFCDEGFVGGIKKDDGVIGFGEVNPFLERLFGRDDACWIIGITQIDEVNRFAREFGSEIVFSSDREVDQPCILPAFVGWSCPANHDVGIDIDGINWIEHGDLIFEAEDIEDVSGVTFTAVRNEDLISGDIDAAILEIVFGDSFSEEVVALFGAIAFERLTGRHFIECCVHGFDASRGERFGDIADAQTDDIGVGIGC